MPRFDPASAAGPLVRGFGADGTFVVQNERHASVLLTPEQAIAWSPPSLTQLTIDDFEPIIERLRVAKLLLFGSGPKLSRPPKPVWAELLDWGIGIEPMDSRTAARTWAVLRAEDRDIVAALMPLR